MNRKKLIRFVILPLLSIVILISVVVGMNTMNSKISSIILPEFIERGEYDGLSLTIYYLSPFAESVAPLEINELIYGNNPPKKKNEILGLYDYRITSLGGYENFEILKQLANIDLVPIKNESRINARIYYVFENEKGQKICDVGMWGYPNNSVYFNGLEVEWNDVFSEVIIPCLPEKAAKQLELYVSENEGLNPNN